MVAAVVVVVEDEQEVDYEVWPSVAVPVVELEVGSEYSVASSFLLVATHYTGVNNWKVGDLNLGLGEVG